MANAVPPADYDPQLLSSAWRDVQGTDEGGHLTRELEREVSPAHVLEGAEFTAMAVRGYVADPRLDLSSGAIEMASAFTGQQPKQVIYWVPSLDRWAVVHLTWATETESHPDSPSTVLARHWTAVIDELRDRDRL